MKRPMTVIIGGTSTLGKTISLRVAAHRGTVIVASDDVAAGMKLADEISEAGAMGVFMPYEPTKFSADFLVSKCDELGGMPEILITCALAELKLRHPSHLDRALAPWKMCYESAAFASRAFAEAMKKTGGGSILNIGSLETSAPLPQSRTSKAASIFSLSQMLCADFGSHGIRVNGIAPQCKLHELLQNQVMQPWAALDRRFPCPPLRAILHPENVAEAAHLVTSMKAKSSNGRTFNVEAGYLLPVSVTTQISASK